MFKRFEFLNFVVTGKRGREEGERGGDGEEEVVGLSFLHGAAAEIFGQPIQLVHEKIDLML